LTEAFAPEAGERPVLGLLAVGLEAYWAQFEGLRPRLLGYLEEVEGRLACWGRVVSGGLADTPVKARAAGTLFRHEDVDLVLVHAATYATSSQVLPAVQRAGAPVLVLNLQPQPALDYEHVTTAEWLANCSACCVPEICYALERAGISFRVVSGTLTGSDVWQKIGTWCRAAGAARAVRDARLGFLGHTYPGMLDLYSDFTAVHGQLGSHVEVMEIDDLVARASSAPEPDVARKVAEIHAGFDVAEPGSDPIAAPIEEDDLAHAARVAVGLDRLTSDFDLQGLAYYYRGLEGNDAERVAAGMIVGCSLLTARGIPCSGEGDLKNAIAMLVMDRLGAGGSFTEFYAMDFDEDFVLMGHDGPGHVAIADGRPVVRKLQLYHGKRGLGVSVEFKVRLGPVTILGVTQGRDGRLRLICAEGESLPGATFRIGNTNSRVRFQLPPGDFVTAWSELGPTHHVALGVGHQAATIEKVGYLLRLETVRVA
jgi:L-arabinose isomerase